VAIKLANLIDSTFGPDKRHGVPGHEEIELALFKLADETGDSRYQKLAEFFVSERGRAEGRKLYGLYHQDHAPVTQATEVVGHAVRQMYLLCAATDLARRTDDAAYVTAVDRLWDDLVHRKMYITGGVGARHEGEAFGEAFDLPNASAYAETCAGIGSALFGERLNQLHADAKYFDAVERTLYNGFLSGVSLSGDKFFYVNPLASDGNHHRKSWYDCACCPPNVVRFMANLPALMYASSYTPQQDLDRVYVNLFAGGTAQLKLHDGTSIELVQETRYPWDGRVTITLACDASPAFELLVRLPGWAKGASVKVNGQDAAERIERGYAVLSGTWHSGDRVELNLPMPIERVHADPRVKANVGRVALQRGPVVYCVESADNKGSTHELRLPTTATLSTIDRAGLLGGVTVIQSDTGLTAIPYYAWDNRAPGQMDVWVMEE
jgi:DUF1680 family protein